MNKATHTQRFISFKQIKHVRRNEIKHYQTEQGSTNKPNSIHFSQWHKVPRGKGLSSIKVNLIGIKNIFKKARKTTGATKISWKENKAIKINPM